MTCKTVQKCARISTENKEMSTCLKEDINQPPEDKFTVTNRCRTEEKQSHFVLKECNIVIIISAFCIHVHVNCAERNDNCTMVLSFSD